MLVHWLYIHIPTSLLLLETLLEIVFHKWFQIVYRKWESHVGQSQVSMAYVQTLVFVVLPKVALPKVLSKMTHWHDEKFTCLAKDLFSFLECNAINIAKLEGRMFGWLLFWINKFTVGNSFSIMKEEQHSFELCFDIHTFFGLGASGRSQCNVWHFVCG
jgi:hypothetical protein